MPPDTPPPNETKSAPMSWTNINIGIKEFLAGIVFVATMSGVYYKLYYQQSEDKITTAAALKAAVDKAEALEKRVVKNEENIRALQDESTARNAVEGVTAIPYTPMKPKKQQ